MGQGTQTCWNNHTSDRWKQLKKDYVPGYGDTIDLVVIAGSWEKDRARELRGRYCPGFDRANSSQSTLVPPSTITRFYIGVLGNSSQCTADVSSFS
jgi:DNA ligase-4